MSNAYVLSRLPNKQSYEDTIAHLGRRKTLASSLQLLPFFELDDAVVAPLTKLAVESTNRGQTAAILHLLRLARYVGRVFGRMCGSLTVL